MHVDNIITAVNNNDIYLSFAEITTLAWRKLFNRTLAIAYVCNGDNTMADDINIQRLADAGASVYVFPKHPIMDYGVQTKITRMALAAMIEGNNMIVDIDMIPLHYKLLDFINSNSKDGDLVKFGYDHPAFQNDPDIGKWPMDKTVAPRDLWLQMTNGIGSDDWCNWTATLPDRRANVFNQFHNFSDESLLKCLAEHYNIKRISKIRRTDYPYCTGGKLHGRLDRAEHTTASNSNIEHFFECHGPRPFNVDWYAPILKHLNS